MLKISTTFFIPYSEFAYSKQHSNSLNIKLKYNYFLYLFLIDSIFYILLLDNLLFDVILQTKKIIY